MKNVIKTLSLGLLLSAPFMQGEEQSLGLMDMPDDVLYHIFSQLGAIQNPIDYIESLAKLRKTCSRFDSLLNDNKVAILVRQKFSQQELEKHFFEATIKGDSETVTILLEKGFVDINTQNKNGDTALIHVARNFCKCYKMGVIIDNDLARKLSNIVDIVIKSGANINQQSDTDGTTALIWASFYKIENLKTKLINNGANQNLRDKNGMKASDWSLF